MKFLFVFLLIIISNISFAQDYKYRYKAEGIIYGEAVVSNNTAPSIITSAIDDGTTTISYNFLMSATDAEGGSLTWSWSGDIPPGLNINTNGEISGTPSLSGVYNVSITVTDNVSASRSENFVINIFDFCETEPIGAVCSDGAIYVGNNDSGDRLYMASSDLTGQRRYGLVGLNISSEIPNGIYDQYNGEEVTNLLSPTYDGYNDSYRTGTAAMDCRNELGSEWYLPSVPEIELIVNNDSVPSSGTLKTNGNIQNSTYLASSPVNNTNHMSYRFFSSSAYILARNSIGYVRCFRK